MLFIRKTLAVSLILAVLIVLGVLGALLLGRLMPETRLQQLIMSVSAVVFSLALILAVFSFYVNHGFGYQGDIVRRVKTDEKLVAITFDDGPTQEYTPKILDVLKAYDVQASFFLVGSHVKKYPEIAKRVHSEGHDIGNHTYTHINVPTSPAAAMSSQLLTTNIEIMKITGESPIYARPPRGMYDARFRRLAELMGMQVVLWSLSSQDWRESVTPARMHSQILKRVQPGDIILLHDGGNLLKAEGASRQRTVDVLPGLIEGLREKGYRIAPLSRLLRYPHVDHIDDLEEQKPY